MTIEQQLTSGRRGAPGDNESARLVDDPEHQLREFLSRTDYPCLGARSVVKQSRLSVVVASSLRDLDARDAMGRISAALRTAAATSASRADGDPFHSTAVVFREPVMMSETEFEDAMWTALRRLAAVDAQPWATEVSSDPSDPRFAFSFAGSAFFVVGMHPMASRRARRTPLPTLVFNAHRQFEGLRATGGFERMRDTIRRRDVRWQGSVNPMMADHGHASEARQYSGRHVPEGWQPSRRDEIAWRCPWMRAAS